jgi:hypothetical protein
MPYKDPAKRKEASREWRLANLEKFKQRQKEWKRANPEYFKQRSKEWKEANPEKAKQHRRKQTLKRHGWTPEMLVQTLREQGGRCAICRLPMNPPCADHKHVTPPEPRALLCINCNTMIGQAQENPETCRAAADYLEAWS